MVGKSDDSFCLTRNKCSFDKEQVADALTKEEGRKGLLRDYVFGEGKTKMGGKSDDSCSFFFPG